MIMMSGKYPCSFCCESFVFEKTLQLHKQKIHYDNHETFKTAVTSIGDQVSTNIGRNIKISIGGGESLSKKPFVKKKSNIIKKLCVKRQRVRSSAHQCSECDLKTADYSLLLAHTALEHGPGPRHSVIFPRGVVHRVENGWGLTKVAVVLLNGLLW